MQRTLLFLLVAASYLLAAGGPPWAIGPLIALATLAALVAPVRTFAFPIEHRLLDLSLVAIVVSLLAQVIPLPAGVVAWLSPHAVVLRSTLGFAGLADPSWPTLSLDPAATRDSLANVVLGIVSFWVARAVFGAGGNTRAFCRALAVFAATVAVLAIVQKAVTPRLVLFVLPSEVRSASPFGAFVNRNHFGAWLLLVAAPVGGYLIARFRTHPAFRSRRWRDSVRQFFGSGIVLTAAAGVTIIAVLFATLSRSAVAGLGAAAICGWRLGQHRLGVERTSVPATLGLIGAAIILVIMFVDTDGWSVRLQESLDRQPGGSDRLTIWRESLPIVRDFWLTGSGAGTFSDVMTQYQQTRVWVGSMQRWAHFNNAHSSYLQVASEGGLLLALPVLTAIGALQSLGRKAVRADKGEMFWVRVGAAAGLAGLAVQSIWEVPLVMPANAVLGGVVAGLMLFRRERARSESDRDGLTTPGNGLNRGW